VRSSTRATSPGSLRAKYELGRLASESRSNVPASTSSWHRRSYSSAEPSHQTTSSGWVREAASSTHVTSFWFFVGTVVDLTVRFTLLVRVQGGASCQREGSCDATRTGRLAPVSATLAAGEV